MQAWHDSFSLSELSVKTVEASNALTGSTITAFPELPEKQSIIEPVSAKGF